MSGFGNNPTTTTQPALPTNQFPLSSVAVPGNANADLTALEGGPISTDSNGNPTAPASMYVKDGSDVTQGVTTDAAVTTDIAATISAKLRGLVKISGDIWDSANHRIRVDGSGVTQPISAASLPLPSGAATSAKQPALGTAGSASADVLTVQGIASMTPVKVDGSGVTQPISGSVSVSNFPGTQPVSGTVTANAGTGTFTNQQSNTQIDYDSGAGTQNLTVFGVALPASGGAVAGGTSSNPLRIDPTGTTTQPVSGTVNAAQSGTWNITNISGTVSLPTGAATAAKQPALGTAGSASSDVLTVQGIASMTALKTDGSGVTQPVSGTVTANQGGTWTVQPGNTANTTAWKVDGSAVTQPVSGTVTSNIGTTNGLALDASVSGVLVSQGSTTSGQKGPLVQGAVTTAAPTYTTAQTSPISLTTAGAVRVDGSAVTQPVSGTVSITANSAVNLAQVAGTTTDVNSGNKSAGTQRVVIATDQPQLTNALKVDGSGVTQPVSGTFWQATQPISGTVTANAGTGTFTNQQSNITTDYDTGAGTQTMTMFGVALPASGGAVAGGTATNPLKTDPTGTTTQPVSGTVNAAQSGTWNITNVSGTVSLPTGAATSAKQPALGTAGSASSDVLTVQGIASMTALKVDGSGVTQPVSGTVTANAGTNLNTSALALDTSVNGVLLSQGSTTSGQKGPLIQGAVTTNAPSYTTAQTNPLSLDTSGLLRTSLKDTPSNTNNLNVNLAASAATVTVSGTVTANQGGSNWSTNMAQIGGTNVVTGGASGLLAVGGPVASGASNADNPVKVGGAFNTTQPTVTTGQIVDAQMTARGAQIVATGTDTFTVVANAGTNLNTSALALETGGNLATLAGAVTSAKVQANTAQINGVAPSMGNGVSGTGVQRVTIASDSTGQVALAAGAATIGAVTQASGPWTSNVTQIAGSSISTAATGVQKVGIVGNGGATVDSTVGAGSAPTNAIVVGAVYNSSAPAPANGQAMAVQADQAGNIREFPGIALATLSAWNSSTSLNATQNIFTNSGAAAVLVQLTQTTTLTAGAITFEVSYDGSNWSTIPANCVLDPTSSTFAQISLPYTVQASTNKAFLLNMNGAQALRIKLSTQITGSGTVTPNYALLPLSPADTVIALSPTAANFNVTAVQSGAWTAVPNSATSGGSTPSHTISASGTNATNLKNSAGQVYGFSISNSNAAARFFKLYNTSSAPTVGTTTPIMTVQVPANGTVIRAFPVGLTFTTGISWGLTTGIADNDTGSVGTDLSIDIDYK